MSRFQQLRSTQLDSCLSSQLGIPTANIPPEGLSSYPDLSTGIYFGYTSLLHPPSSTSTNQNTTVTAPAVSKTAEGHLISSLTSPTSSAPPPDAINNSISIYPSVLSIGYNPYYNNSTKSIEIHVLHSFESDFYGSNLNLLVLGFIRPEYDYVSKESLISDIMVDCEVAKRSLGRDAYKVGAGQGWEGWLRDFGWAEGQSELDVANAERRVLGGDKEDGKL